MAVAMIGVLMATTVGAGYVGAAVVARHRAQSAADLAALAAAGRLAGGAGVACGQAAVVATAMRATVVRCDTDGLDVVVAVAVPVELGRFGSGPAHAVARAGPAAADG
ncbi:Rv3654c family TadE-like protein [Mycobacterium sp. IDR2000157661]|uniref:Rv3654c family TadE-like protein n=1 Tax=Mycobacterium sp. IDR2000157661 TaxID=2867005 RepID=UPI00351D5DA2